MLIILAITFSAIAKVDDLALYLLKFNINSVDYVLILIFKLNIIGVLLILIVTLIKIFEDYSICHDLLRGFSRVAHYYSYDSEKGRKALKQIIQDKWSIP